MAGCPGPHPAGAVEPLYSGDSRVGNGLQVSVYAFPGYVPADEMEPSLGIKDLAWLLESGFVSGAERSREYLWIGNYAHWLRPHPKARQPHGDTSKQMSHINCNVVNRYAINIRKYPGNAFRDILKSA